MKPERLSPLDCSFLSMDGPVTVGHVCIVLPFDGPLTMAQVRAAVEARIHRVPAMRRRLQTTLVGFGRPWWVDAHDFDLDQHLFEITLSGDGGDVELSKHVARLSTGRLNRAHPLWEIHLVNGMKGDRSSLVVKIHHSLADGIGVRDLLFELFAASEDGGAILPPPREELDWAVGPVPSEVELVVRSVLDAQGWLGTLARWEYRASAAVGGAAEKALSSAASALTARLGRKEVEATPPQPEEEPKPDRSWWTTSAPECILNGQVTAARRWAFGSRGLHETRALRQRTETTINDVILASTAGALRAWLLESAALPADPLVAMVPIGAKGPVGGRGANHLALTLCTLATDLEDPLERLLATHEHMLRAKTAPSLDEAILEDLTRVTAPGFTGLAVGAVHRLRLANRWRLPFNVVVTNVPGTPQGLGLGGRRVFDLLPCPPISEGIGLNVAAHGYRDRLAFGVGACADLVPDAWHFMGLLLAEHDRLLGLGMDPQEVSAARAAARRSTDGAPNDGVAAPRSAPADAPPRW